MKRLIGLLIVPFLVFFISSTFAQSSNYKGLAKNSWNLGFGLGTNRYVSTNVEVNQGWSEYLSIQRNFSEHIGLRFRGGYATFSGKIGNTKIDNNTISGDFDMVYYLVPCEPISPYLAVGAGGIYYTISNSPNKSLNKSLLDYELNLDMGVEWDIHNNWKIKTELGYHSLPTSRFDGNNAPSQAGGILGSSEDSYMNFEIGAVYYFDKGEKSHLCDLYDGLAPKIDYNRIEDIVKKYATKPTEVDYNRIEDIVKKNKTVAAPANNWVLIGVNFDFAKTSIRPESLPILYNAAEILLTHPNISAEIQGYTDNIGSKSFNQKLSLERAQSVKDFLVAKGVSADRLTTVGYGEADPISNNKTAQGRALNRRIEFKVTNK